MPEPTKGQAVRRTSVGTRLEYLLYALEVENPGVLRHAENFFGGMLTNDQRAGDRARELAAEFAKEQLHQ